MFCARPKTAWLASSALCIFAACAAEGGEMQKPAMRPDSSAPAALGCDIDTGYPGDDVCLPPPPPGKGFQVRIGPRDYANPEPEYVLMPSEEITTLLPAVSGNTEPIYYYYRQYRMRPGTHHLVLGTADASGIDNGRRLAITNHQVEDNPKGGVIAPENQGVGIMLGPKTPLIADMHSINVTDKPMLREAWVNFWYRDARDVTEPVLGIAHQTDTTYAIPPRADTMLGPYRCSVIGTGRVLWMYGHRHANNQRFSAWRVRGETRTLIYEAFNWEDPLLLEFSSIVENPVPDRERRIEGGYSGVLDVKPGDILEHECHVINKTDGYLRFTNENFTGEMCILDAELIGATCL